MHKAHQKLPDDLKALREHILRALEAVNARDDSQPLRTATFVFVREMMRAPWNEAVKENPERVADAIEVAWRSGNVGRSFWSDFDEYDSEPYADRRGHFVRVWLNMRCPPNADPLSLAKVAAEQSPVTLRFKAPMLDNPAYLLLLGILFHLQKRYWPKTVALPQERLAQMIGKSQETISGYLVLAERSGIIKKIARHNFEAGRAAKFEVATDLFKPVS